MEGANRARETEDIRGEVEKIISMPCPWKESVSIAGTKGEYWVWKRKKKWVSFGSKKKGERVKMKYFINLLVFLKRCLAESSYCDYTKKKF